MGLTLLAYDAVRLTRAAFGSTHPSMTEDMLNAVLKRAGCKLTGTEAAALPDGRSVTFYVAHDGVSLSVSRVTTLRRDGNLLAATNNKGEEYLVALEDVFAASIAGGSDDKPARKAGFLG